MPSLPQVPVKGWIVMPRKLRDLCNVKAGSKVLLTEAERSLKIVPSPEDPVKAFTGILQDFPLLTELLDSRREDKDREELRLVRSRYSELFSNRGRAGYRQ
jgi:bifunctional DNA-binding transcriptional regulator/antitoxin component of YhaV-PrlF toxin-antitoxin module